ncbi:MAG: flagellar hook-basal body complex protein FliE [Acidobacteriota bacterium]|nr:MAG: flagellar hook-basal body complex protein FliE [Acidobacteriota bacterium]
MDAARIGEIANQKLRELSRQDHQLPRGDATPTGPTFAEAMENALSTVEGQLESADSAAKSYIVGEAGDLHNVLLEMERADLSLRTLMQVRNKLLEAYNEIMRMPV